MTEEREPPAKRPKRTYRACYPCRSRKLKCSFGDPNMPWDGPCERCLRETRECERAKPTFVRAAVPRKTDVSPPDASPPKPKEASAYRKQQQPPPQWDDVESSMLVGDNAESESSDEEGTLSGDNNPLVSSKLQNPSDALRLLATASSLEYQSLGSTYPAKESRPGPVGNNVSTWMSWEPLQQGLLTVQDARALFSFFELEMAALFPLIHPMLFEPYYLATLVRDESLLLGTMLTIAARYSNVLADRRGAVLHVELSQWVRLQLMRVMDGDPALRSICTVEALLLLSEWPMLPMRSGDADSPDPESEELLLLKPSIRYDAYAWSNIGWAVRLAQELGIQETVKSSAKNQNQLVSTWKEERMLKTWIYCCNADRHIAVRLGRNAVVQETMSSRWWEELSHRLNSERRKDSNDVWTSDVFLLGCMAQLLGTVQEHLYSHKDVTRSLLRTGAWEAFMRRLRLEIRYSKRACQSKLNDGTVESALLRMEFDYVVLYAYSLTLRALQGKLRRRRQANDLHYRSPSLLNLVEGPWIMEALHAARSIIEITLNVLEKRDILRYVPSRCFQYCLFAATFMYKALATGMVEYGQQSTSALLDKVVHALQRASIDDQHFVRGFAGLLVRLGKHWDSEGQASTSPSVLNPALTSDTPQAQAQPQGAPEPSIEALLGTNVSPSSALAPLMDDFQWNFDPTFQMPAADHEQDLLFQSIWDTGGQDATGSTSNNLYATLLGDALNFPDGLDGV